LSRAGKLRALAVTTSTRWEGLPDIPTVGEFVPGYDGSGWYGIGAPKGTPVEIINRLNTEINAGLADPKMKVRVAEMGETTLAASPAAFFPGLKRASASPPDSGHATDCNDMVCDRMLIWSRSPLGSLLGQHLDEKDHSARRRDQRA
jgi:hypothetical protein